MKITTNTKSNKTTVVHHSTGIGQEFLTDCGKPTLNARRVKGSPITCKTCLKKQPLTFEQRHPLIPVKYINSCKKQAKAGKGFGWSRGFSKFPIISPISS